MLIPDELRRQLLAELMAELNASTTCGNPLDANPMNVYPGGATIMNGKLVNSEGVEITLDLPDVAVAPVAPTVPVVTVVTTSVEPTTGPVTQTAADGKTKKE